MSFTSTPSSGITAPAVLAAAYLVEDTEATLQDIDISFGEQIAELVYWLTDAEQGGRRIRKIMTAWRLGRAPSDAKMIKARPASPLHWALMHAGADDAPPPSRG